MMRNFLIFALSVAIFGISFHFLAATMYLQTWWSLIPWMTVGAFYFGLTYDWVKKQFENK